MELSNGEGGKTKNSDYWIYFFRQLFSCSMVIMNFFIMGLFTGAPTVIIAQMRKEVNSSDVITTEIISWLSSIPAYSAIPWTIILPLLAYRFGRKIVLMLLTFNILIANIFFYYSTSVIDLMISEAFQGIIPAAVMSISIMVMSEYTSPKYRGILLNIKSATLYWGVWVSNAIGTFFHWRNIGIVAFICGFYNLSSIFCYESPYWLATKGRFDECSKVHRWLKGTDKDSEKELSKLILSQKERLDIESPENNQTITVRNIVKFLNTIRYKGFYRPLVYALMPICLYNFSGKLVCTVYAIDIIKKITSSEKMSYNGMLILDAVTVFSMYLGCALSKFVSRRKHLLVLSSIGVLFLYVLSIYLYLINFNIISEDKHVSLFLLTGFSMSISCGPMIVATSCTAELAPLRNRSYFLCCLSILSNIIFGTILKISPFVFKYGSTHGAFLFYAMSGSFFIFLLYKYLPETKDKTIQEIEEYISKDHCATSKTVLLPLKKLENTQ